MRAELNQGLIDFLKASPTPFHATRSMAQRLQADTGQYLPGMAFERAPRSPRHRAADARRKGALAPPSWPDGQFTPLRIFLNRK